MKGARYVVLGIALAAGGAAAYLVRGDDPPPAAAPAPVVQVDSDDVLVAGTTWSRSIRLGPDVALAGMANGRRRIGEFHPKERPAECDGADHWLDRPWAVFGGRAYSRRQAHQGRWFRLSGGSAAGRDACNLDAYFPRDGGRGFILPNDRVDVVLIRAQKTSAGEVYSSETILSNVRVLAIDQTVEEKNGQRVVVGKIATLALNARNAETLVLSTRLGTLALALRSLADAKQADADEADSTGLRSRAGVNVVRYGQSGSDFK